MNDHTCNHTDTIARDLYSLYQTDLDSDIDSDWDALPTREQIAWRKVAGNLLPVLGRHALGELRAYAKRKGEESTSSPPNIIWRLLGVAALATAGWLSLTILTGCGHTIEASREDGIIICKDGTCLTIKNGHITYGSPFPTKTPVPVIKSRK